jgi:hypothetical protein
MNHNVLHIRLIRLIRLIKWVKLARIDLYIYIYIYISSTKLEFMTRIWIASYYVLASFRSCCCNIFSFSPCQNMILSSSNIWTVGSCLVNDDARESFISGLRLEIEKRNTFGTPQTFWSNLWLFFYWIIIYIYIT